MRNTQPIVKINYELVQSAIYNKNILLVNTMNSSSQECLGIKHIIYRPRRRGIEFTYR